MMKNYKEAAKCFDQAIKYNPDNLQIYRDTGNLYLHSKEYIAHKEIRRRFVGKRPDIYTNWCAFSFACYLSRDYEQAIDILDSLIKLIQKDEDFNALAKMGVYWYRARLLKKLGRTDELIKFLKENSKILKNKVKYCEELVEAYTLLDDKEECKKYLDYLLNELPDNIDYIKLYLDLNEGDSIALLDGLKEKVKSTITDALVLERLGDEQIDVFKTRFAEFFIKNIKRGSPSFVRDFRQFMNSKGKIKEIDEMFKKNMESLENTKKLVGDEEENDPTALLFALYQYSYFLYYNKEYERSLEFINKAIEHSPTYADLYVLKAKILKKQGNIKQASETAILYQGMDTADRCLATSAVIILHKAGKIIKADEIFKTFVNFSGSVENMIHDNQKVRYELGCANAYKARLNFKRALRLYKLTLQHFDEYKDDQYDFYTYTLRRFRIDLVIDMVDFNDIKVKNTGTYIKVYGKYLTALQLYAEYKKNDQVTDADDKEVIDIDEVAEKNHDLSGTKYMEKLNIENEVQACLENVSMMDFRKAKKGDGIRLCSALFNHYISTKKVVPLIKVYSYLLENEFKSPMNILRKKQFDYYIKQLDQESLNEIEKKILSQFLDKIEDKQVRFEERFKTCSLYSKDSDLSKVTVILRELAVGESWREELKEKLGKLYKDVFIQKFKELDYKVKTQLAKVCRDFIVDSEMYIALKSLILDN